MAYVDQTGQANRKTGIVAVVAIHAVLGTVLVTGLSGGVFTPEPKTTLTGENIDEIELPPPPTPKPDDIPDTTSQQDIVFAPDSPIPLPSDTAPFQTTDILPLPGDTIINIVPPSLPGTAVGTAPTPPAFDPVAAKPSNNTSQWVTTADYRTSWINRGMAGIASFKLSVGANGRVQDCRILSSTGHGALDDATCKLVKRRARFTPARDENGKKIAGAFSTSIRWILPD